MYIAKVLEMGGGGGWKGENQLAGAIGGDECQMLAFLNRMLF